MNKNSVPNDPKSPFVTSGIRVGAPAIYRCVALKKRSERTGWLDV
ncbi:hypothetical protein ACNKHM_20405 [Shigella sonnei]